MTALLEVSKRALDSIPNVELITFLFIIFTLFYGKKVILAALAFTGLEIAFWGPHVWVVMYLYMWPLLILVVDSTRKHAHHMFYCILAGFFGLFFGLLCSPVYLFIGGPSTMLAWWIAGIPFDVIHGISNFLICLILYRPACYIISLLKKGSPGS